ncbi:hypothetical protein JQ607_03160 [Bradyrhizobium liaoningense]|uniref:hypothetical protein n=1 Tax=Bradyrhizobium liaoningense TaxID=43992 RepID=UPI001BA9B58A|nr:hypothetical protein [Bradyrhizobium liaoningense]MBR0839183.1 hypothetical protein [Bradyrhizobium liaoningense]MBR0857624.1 hypothetical protein [Bradyrhizobium liaoningense]
MRKMMARDQNQQQAKRFGGVGQRRDQTANIVALKTGKAQNGWVTRVGNETKNV